MANAAGQANRPAVDWAALWFRLARVFFLMLVVVMPMAQITAAREMALVGAVVFMALHLAVARPGLRATVLWLPLAVWALTAVLSLLTAVDFGYSLEELRGQLLKSLACYYLAVHFVQRRRHLVQAWQMLLAGTMIMSLAAAVLFFIDGGSLGGHKIRAASLHYGYQALGTFLVTAWPYALMALRGLRVRPWSWLAWGLTALMPLAAYITYSRATWAAMVVEAGVLAVLMSRRRLRAALAGLVAAAVVVALLLAVLPGATHGERWRMAMTNPEKMGGTAGDLCAVWSHSLDEIGKSPFVGIGLGRHSFSKAYPEFRATHQPLLWHAHNMFLDTALQLGVQGLAALLWVLLMLLWSLWPTRPPRRDEPTGLFAAATVAMVVGFCLRNMTDDFFADDSLLLFWLLAGLAMGGRALVRREAFTSGQAPDNNGRANLTSDPGTEPHPGGES